MNMLKWIITNLILWFFFVGLVVACNAKKEPIYPTQETIVESVYASLTVQPEDLYDVYAGTQGIVEQVFVNEGDTVAKGQLLVQIKADMGIINMDNAQQNLALANENLKGEANVLENLVKDIEAAKMQLNLDSTNFYRLKRLQDQNIGKRTDFDVAKLKFELSRQNLAILKRRYDQQKLELENKYLQSRNALKQAKTTYDDFFIKSMMDGKVYQIFKNEGEQVSVQQPVAQVGKANSFIIEMMIDEVDVAKIVVGQKVLVVLDAYPNEVITAKVTKIYPVKDTRTQTFKIEGKFVQPPAVLYAGLSGEANIIISQKQNALTIPAASLVDEKYVLTPDGKQEVKIGLRNLEKVEVLSGIDETTAVIIP